MIARHETPLDKHDIWSALSAPLPPGVISWRQDGRPVSRDGRHIARFVAYIEANTVRERLDSVVPGEWDLTLELLQSLAFVRRQARAFAAVTLRLAHPIAERLGRTADLGGDGTDGRPLRFMLASMLAHQPNGTLPYFR